MFNDHIVISCKRMLESVGEDWIINLQYISSEDGVFFLHKLSETILF